LFHFSSLTKKLLYTLCCILLAVAEFNKKLILCKCVFSYGNCKMDSEKSQAIDNLKQETQEGNNAMFLATLIIV
jgi:hypothetical protein